MNTKIKRLTALNYFGGKSRYLDWLLPLFPSHKNYVEPFCGSASVFLNKKPSPIETINDMDGRLLNFMRILRERPAELIHLLDLTLYSRAEFQYALAMAEDPLEDARRFFVRAMQSFGGQCDTSRRINSWRIQMSESRRGISLETSKWLTKISGLPEVVARLKQAQIENRDFEYVIRKFDAIDTFHYCDPPYLQVTRTGKSDYKFELADDGHERLASVLNECKGMVALSGYDHAVMDKLYPAAKWFRTVGPDRATNLGKRKLQSREMLWTNYNPKELVSKTLF